MNSFAHLPSLHPSIPPPYLAINVVYPFFSVFTLSYSVLLIKVLHCSVNELLEQPSVHGHFFILFFQRSLKPLLLFWSLLCQLK